MSATQRPKPLSDISEQMRNVARRMTPQEIEQAAQYYASQPIP
jgi:hypothetical protein